MITMLIALNGFVFMSMRDFNLQENLFYTTVLVSVMLLVLTVSSYLRKGKKKKSLQDPLS